MKRTRLKLLLPPLFLSVLSVACEDCEITQAETNCWSHEGSAANSCADSLDPEPNGTLPTARNVDLDCSTRILPGTLGPHDVDVFKASAKTCPDSLPNASWSATTGRLCMFAGCAHGLMNFAGCKDGHGEPLRYREGILGCCVEGKGSVVLDVHCSPLEKNMQVWLVVDNQEPSACENYEISYSN